MAYLHNWDSQKIMHQLACMIRECQDPLNDGFTACHCKQQLYHIKCFIEDHWRQLPLFPEQERQWEQQRIIQQLKR